MATENGCKNAKDYFSYTALAVDHCYLCWHSCIMYFTRVMVMPSHKTCCWDICVWLVWRTTAPVPWNVVPSRFGNCLWFFVLIYLIIILMEAWSPPCFFLILTYKKIFVHINSVQPLLICCSWRERTEKIIKISWKPNQDYHNELKDALSSFNQYCDNGEFLWEGQHWREFQWHWSNTYTWY
jgi:hypothetical protein